jgi:hypothetical protein
MLAIVKSLSVAACMLTHAMYISMTDVNYNNKTRTVEISVRIFTDDFQKTLSNSCHCKVDLFSVTNEKATQKVISSYLLNHLQIKVNNQLQNLEFVGYQQENESVWNFLQITNVSSVKKMEILNTLLHDYTKEQINMLHIKANGKDETEKLDYPDKLYTVSF